LQKAAVGVQRLLKRLRPGPERRPVRTVRVLGQRGIAFVAGLRARIATSVRPSSHADSFRAADRARVRGVSPVTAGAHRVSATTALFLRVRRRAPGASARAPHQLRISRRLPGAGDGAALLASGRSGRSFGAGPDLRHRASSRRISATAVSDVEPTAAGPDRPDRHRGPFTEDGTWSSRSRSTTVATAAPWSRPTGQGRNAGGDRARFSVSDVDRLGEQPQIETAIHAAVLRIPPVTGLSSRSPRAHARQHRRPLQRQRDRHPRHQRPG
jgi:hypothetical protein